MSSTKHTANYNLPIFAENDIPTWLGDWNGAMNTIDTNLKNISNSSESNVDKTYVDKKIEEVNTSINKINEQVTQITSDITSMRSTLNDLIDKAVTWDASNTGITAKQYEQLKIKANS